MAQRYPPDVQCSFLHGPIDRAEAEQHLIRFADRDGWFLVRRKEGQRDTLVLSVVVAPRVEHHIITLPAYSIGPFQGPHSCLYELIQLMRMPRSGWHVPLTTPCTRKMVTKGEDAVGMDMWVASRPARPEPQGGWPSESESESGSRPASHQPVITSPVWPSDDEEESADGVYDTARAFSPQGPVPRPVGEAVGPAWGASAMPRPQNAGRGAPVEELSRLSVSQAKSSGAWGGGSGSGGGGGGAYPAPIREPVYDAQPDAVMQRLHQGPVHGADTPEEPMYASEPVLANARMQPAISQTRPSPHEMSHAGAAPPRPPTSSRLTDDFIHQQREASRSGFGVGGAASLPASGQGLGVRRGFAPPPLPATMAPNEPSYAEVDPEPEPAAAINASPTKYVTQTPKDPGAAAVNDADDWMPEEESEPIQWVPEEVPQDQNTADTVSEAPSSEAHSRSPNSSPDGGGAAGVAKDGGVSKGGPRQSVIKRMFSISRKPKARKDKQSSDPASGLQPKVSIGAIEDEASSTTPCSYYGSVAVGAPCGIDAIESALDVLYRAPYAENARVAGCELKLTPQRATIRDLHGDLLTETPLYSVTYAYTDPDAAPRLFVFISASVGAENKYSCAVLEVEGNAGYGAEVKRKLDAALTVAQLDIRYDGPDTFAANGYK